MPPQHIVWGRYETCFNGDLNDSITEIFFKYTIILVENQAILSNLGQLLGQPDIYLHTMDPCGVGLGRVPNSHLALPRDLASKAQPQDQHASLMFILMAGVITGCSLSTMCQSICHSLFRARSLAHMYIHSLWLFVAA